jgi:hypothetical protein
MGFLLWCDVALWLAGIGAGGKGWTLRDEYLEKGEA